MVAAKVHVENPNSSLLIKFLDDYETTKGRLMPLTDRTTQDKKMSKRGVVEELKIFVEADKVKNPDTIKTVTNRESVARKSGSYLPNNYKSGTKNLEKGKGKPDKSMSSNVGRKVLADIGNRTSSISKTGAGKTSGTGKGKLEIILYPQSHRGAVDLGKRGASLSSRESVKLDRIRATGDNQASKKFASKNIKATSDEPRVKLQARSSIMATATGMKTVRNPFHFSRNSLPALKRDSQVETNDTEKNKSEKSNSRGKHAFSVKPSARISIVPKPSNLSNRPWGNRVSDGFAAMSSRAQTKVDAGVIPRKSVNATVGTSNTALNTRRNSKSRNILTTKNSSRSGHVDLSMKKQEKASLSKKVSSVKNLRSSNVEISKRKQDKESVSKSVPSVESQDEPVSEEDAISTVINPRRSSDRRESFFSSLMSASKLVKEPSSNAMSRESLPNIYDDRNHLEVCDYVDDIYQYYWVMERLNPPLKNYMATTSDITPKMRGILINWLMEVHMKFELREETLFLTVTLLDRYFSLDLENTKKNEMQLAGLTAFLLASKYEDFWAPQVKQLLRISAEPYTKDQMLTMEKKFLKKLKFRLNEPTPYVFMLRFIKAAQSNKKFDCLAFYLIELCLVEYEALNYNPSMLCASAIYVARCTMRLTPPWTPLLAKHTRYEESQLRECAEMILKFHKAAKTNPLNVTFEKYTNPDLSRVANVKPLDRL